MKRFFHSLVFLVLCGCANPVLSNEEYLNELNVEDNSEAVVVVIPGGSILEIPEVGEADLGLPTNDDILTMPCMCEWEAWRTTNGLMCVGVVCNDSCPQHVVDCNESRRACVVAR